MGTEDGHGSVGCDVIFRLKRWSVCKEISVSDTRHNVYGEFPMRPIRPWAANNMN